MKENTEIIRELAYKYSEICKYAIRNFFILLDILLINILKLLSMIEISIT